MKVVRTQVRSLEDTRRDPGLWHSRLDVSTRVNGRTIVSMDGARTTGLTAVSTKVIDEIVIT